MLGRFISLLGLVLLSPVLVLVAIAIKLDSSGPALFLQDRVGKKQRVFTCVKFRTMAADTPDVPSHESSAYSITSLGGWLRSLKIDELPQLWNVVRGDMRLIGYRPCLPTQNEVIEAREKRGVFSELPGITGLAQVSKVDMSTPDRLADLDAKYIENRSCLYDLRLLMMTVSGAGSGDAARNESP